MSDLIATFLIKDATVGQAIGIKEALAMDLEKYGDVRVVSVDVKEAQQLHIPGTIPRERAKPSKLAASEPRAPLVDKPAEGQPIKYAAATPPCCMICAHYQKQPALDANNEMFWGVCRETGELVYKLSGWCEEWEKRVEPM